MLSETWKLPLPPSKFPWKTMLFLHKNWNSCGDKKKKRYKDKQLPQFLVSVIMKNLESLVVEVLGTYMTRMYFLWSGVKRWILQSWNCNMVKSWNLTLGMGNYKWYNLNANNDSNKKNKSNSNSVKQSMQQSRCRIQES